MGKYIAVKGCRLSETAAKIESQPVTSMTVDNKNPYAGPITISVSNFGDSSILNKDGKGQGVMQPGAKYCSIDNKKFILEGDSVKITVIGTKPGPNGSKLPATSTITVKISSAGQSTTTAD